METEVKNLREKENSDRQSLVDQGKQTHDLGSRLERKMRVLDQENAALKQKLEQQAKLMAKLLDDSKSLARTMQAVKKDLSSEKEGSRYLKTEFEQQSQIVGKLKPEMEIIKQSHERSTKQVKEKINDLEKLTKILKTKHSQQMPLSASVQPNPMPPVHQRDLQIERILGDISELRSEINGTIKYHVGLVPLEVTMHNFRRHKNLSTDWFSSPFYTHPRGYKMCLNVDADGFGEGKGTHVSVFIYMMQGEFDNELKWPFQGTVTVQVLNPKTTEANPCYTVIHFDRNSRPNVAGRVFQGSRADTGQGMLRYIAHRELQHRFLVEDALCFRISRVDFL